VTAQERTRWSGAVLGVAVLLVGGWEAGRAGAVIGGDLGVAGAIAVAMAVAAGTYRLAPGLALGLVWGAALLQIGAGLDIALVQLATVLVAFGTARYGRPVTVWCSGLSIPVGSVIALLYLRSRAPPR